VLFAQEKIKTNPLGTDKNIQYIQSISVSILAQVVAKQLLWTWPPSLAPHANMSADEDCSKRAAEDAQEPDAKRAKVDGDLPESSGEVCATLSKADLGQATWSSSLRELLLALAPSALETPQGQRNGSEEILLRMVDEIFLAELTRLKQCVAGAQAQLEASSAKKSRAETSVEETTTSLNELGVEAKQAWEPLGKDVQLVRDAVAKSGRCMQELLARQKEAIIGVRRECFEPLKDGSWVSDTDKQKHLAALMPLINHISETDVLGSSCVYVLSAKPQERTSFGGVIVQQVESRLDKHIASIDEQLQLVNSAGPAQPATAPSGDEEVTFEQAEAMLNHCTWREMAKERMSISKARRESFELLKAGLENPKEERKHIAELKRVCRKVPESNSLQARFPAVLQKKVDARSDADCKVVQELESALDQRIAALEEQLREEAAPEADSKKLDIDLNGVRQFVDLEAKQREGKQKMLTKDRDAVLELKRSAFEPLKDGSCITPDAPKSRLSKVALSGFNKLAKLLDIESALVKTLTKVLKKKPGAREGSDGLLVQQFEESVDKYIKAKEEQLGTFETTGRYAALKESINAADAAQEELEDALENQRKNLQEGLAAKKKQERMAASLSQKHEAVKERIEDEKQAAARHTDEQATLEQLQRARVSLASLRGTVLGEPPEEAPAEQRDETPVEAPAVEAPAEQREEAPVQETAPEEKKEDAD
jgi:hypothetical protein